MSKKKNKSKKNKQRKKKKCLPQRQVGKRRVGGQERTEDFGEEMYSREGFCTLSG